MRSFLGFGQLPYIGQPFTKAIKYGGIVSQVVPLLFQWISYGASTGVPNINVLVNLENASCRALDQIRSVYIDNLGSPNPVYVYFPDTGQTLSAKANSEGWYPAFTNGKTFWVIGEGFLTGSIPQTFIQVCNLPMIPAVNTEIDQSVALYAASPVITRGTSIYNTQFGVPALGDQVLNTGLPVQNAGDTTPIFGPAASGFFTITGCHVSGVGLATAAGNLGGEMVFESTGVAGILFDWVYLATNQPSSSGVQPIYDADAIQAKIDATQTWRLRNVVAIVSGSIRLILHYTFTP